MKARKKYCQSSDSYLFAEAAEGLREASQGRVHADRYTHSSQHHSRGKSFGRLCLSSAAYCWPQPDEVLRYLRPHLPGIEDNLNCRKRIDATSLSLPRWHGWLFLRRRCAVC